MSVNKIIWHNEKRKISELIPTEYNPRILTAKQKKDLEKSIKKFDLAEIPAINTNNKILAGHMRLKVLQEQKGDIEIDVRVPNRELTEKEAKEYLIRSNKNTGEWDWDILANEFEIQDLIDFGFETFELGGAVIEEDAKEDDYEIPDEIKTDIVRGDLFEIWKDGKLRHKLLCGDSTNIDDVKKLMGSDKIDLYLTDPPYGVSYIGKTKDALKIKNDSMSEEYTHQLWRDVFNLTLTFLKDGGAIYATIPPGSLMIGFMDVVKDAGCLRQCMVWNKGSMVLGHSDYHYKHEPILYGWKPNGKHFFINDRTKTTVFDCVKPNRNADHPTMKPIELWSEFINNSSLKNEIVYDSFSGSGTTMIASHQLNRKAYCMELDEKYCQVILDRMKKLDDTIEIKRV